MKRLKSTMVPAFVAFCALFCAPVQAAATLHEQDQRLLRIADGVQKANAPLCDRLAPSLGVALQSKDQFDGGADPGFRAEVAFAALVPGGAAAGAGIAENDGLLSINGQRIAKLATLQDMPLRDSAQELLARQPQGQPLTFEVATQQGRRTITIMPPSECRALVEVVAGARTVARSDGRIIQIGEGLAGRAADDELAVIFAHELAHSVLHHRDRLSALGVSKGLGGEFGRDRQLNAEAEIEADRLSVHLLANAGYDPAIAGRFWRGELGKQIGGGLFRSRIYSSADQRAQMLDREIADYLAGGAPTWPGHLLVLRRPN